MDDKTLLERAARAAGIYYWLEDDVLLTHGDDGPGSFRQWNPLTDSGQALELAVALEMDIGQMVTEGCVTVTALAFDSDVAAHDVPWGADPTAATRRAIVLVAADLAN